MKESLTITATINTKPEAIYSAWLDSAEHSNMTGGEAVCSDKIGDTFTAWDGYITGKNIELTPEKEIIQEWRTAEFSNDDQDSKLVIQFKRMEGQTELTITHTNIPEGQTQYEEGWVESYINPMKAYFS